MPDEKIPPAAASKSKHREQIAIGLGVAGIVVVFLMAKKSSSSSSTTTTTAPSTSALTTSPYGSAGGYYGYGGGSDSNDSAYLQDIYQELGTLTNTGATTTPSTSSQGSSYIPITSLTAIQADVASGVPIYQSNAEAQQWWQTYGGPTPTLSSTGYQQLSNTPVLSAQLLQNNLSGSPVYVQSPAAPTS